VPNDPDLEMDLHSRRLLLTPSLPEHAEELFSVLNDERLHRFTGGAPLTLEELRARYEKLASRRSPDGAELWLNWTIYRRSDPAALGRVEATVSGPRAWVAWVIGSQWQGRGYASEAAVTIIAWLREHLQVAEIRAHIHPAHVASERVATRAGFMATEEVVDGERVWLLRTLDQVSDGGSSTDPFPPAAT
jgi:RimJ/RimL family protein N-acetyltransferase